jgi:hypothetical protein
MVLGLGIRIPAMIIAGIGRLDQQEAEAQEEKPRAARENEINKRWTICRAMRYPRTRSTKGSAPACRRVSALTPCGRASSDVRDLL